MKSLAATLIALLSAPVLFGQTADDIPPPSSSTPERIRIPLETALQIQADDSGDENLQGELAAMNLAATAQGYVPAGSSGILRSGMQVQVSLMIQGKMEFSVDPQRINESGKIGLPLLHNIEIANQSIERVEDQLTEAYGEYYREPLVNVEFMDAVNDPSLSPWGYVTLMGEVGSPGPIAMPPTRNMTVSAALKKAGGATPTAKKAAIKIFRPLPEEESVERILVNLDDLGQKGRHGEDIQLQAGDVIYVPERIF